MEHLWKKMHSVVSDNILIFQSIQYPDFPLLIKEWTFSFIVKMWWIQIHSAGCMSWLVLTGTTCYPWCLAMLPPSQQNSRWCTCRKKNILFVFPIAAHSFFCHCAYRFKGALWSDWPLLATKSSYICLIRTEKVAYPSTCAGRWCKTCSCQWYHIIPLTKKVVTICKYMQ